MAQLNKSNPTLFNYNGVDYYRSEKTGEHYADDGKQRIHITPSDYVDAKEAFHRSLKVTELKSKTKVKHNPLDLEDITKNAVVGRKLTLSSIQLLVLADMKDTLEVARDNSDDSDVLLSKESVQFLINFISKITDGVESYHEASETLFG